MQSLTEISRKTFATEADDAYNKDPQLRFDQKRLASLVGFAAFGLPLVLFAGGLIYPGGWREGLIDISISHYYYREVVLGDFFVGTLVFIGTLLLAYRGGNENVGKLASVAGLCAFGVALFPTEGWRFVPPNVAVPGTGWTKIAHYGSAAGLFAILAFFCFFVFTLVEPRHLDPSGACLATKSRRNSLYKISGSVIVGMMLAMLIGGNLLQPMWDRLHLTFWCEAAALFAFGVSWITVGRAMNHLLLDPRDKRDRTIVKRREAAQA
jgi:hypothetical protein